MPGSNPGYRSSAPVKRAITEQSITFSLNPVEASPIGCYGGSFSEGFGSVEHQSTVYCSVMFCCHQKRTVDAFSLLCECRTSRSRRSPRSRVMMYVIRKWEELLRNVSQDRSVEHGRHVRQPFAGARWEGRQNLAD